MRYRCRSCGWEGLVDRIYRFCPICRTWEDSDAEYRAFMGVAANPFQIAQFKIELSNMLKAETH